MKELSRRMARIEQRMQPARKLTVIYDHEPDADTREREALAHGDKVLRVIFGDGRKR